MATPSPIRFVDWLTNLTEKTTTINGGEKIHIESSGASQKALVSNIIRYGGGTTRIETAGNSSVTRNSFGALYLEIAGQLEGNTRGASSFEWQSSRSVASAVSSGSNSFSIGTNLTASGNSSVVFGNNALAANYNQISFGVGPSPGAAQGNIQTFYTVTSNSTVKTLNISNSDSDRMVIPPTRSVSFIGILQAMSNYDVSTNYIKSWKIEGAITRDSSNNTRIVPRSGGGSNWTELACDLDGNGVLPSTWSILTISADNTNESLSINVTGQDGVSIRWQATIIYSQIGF